MTAEDKPNTPHLTDKAQREAEAKRERLAQALRDNLQRRKSQARARQGGEGADSAGGGDD